MTFAANLTQKVPQTGVRFAGSGDWVCEWQYPRGAGLWIAAIQWPVTNAPVGTLYVEINGSRDVPIAFEPDFYTHRLVLPAGTPGTYGSWPNVTGVAGNAHVFIKNPAPAMRIGYVRGSGGGVSDFLLTITQRGS